MLPKRYNDYELLYLIDFHSEEAMGIMLEKYEKLIYKKIYQFNFNRSYFDDLVQEGRLSLYKSIKRFNESSNKTFTKFFELVLDHRLIDLSKKLRKNNLISYEDNFDNFKSNYQENNLNSLILKERLEFNRYNLSSLEKSIYDLKFINNYSVKEIVLKLNLTPVQVSNAIQRIKQKLVN